MARRRVTQTRKDDDGDITALCNPDSTWKIRYKTGAIADIEKGEHTYYVQTGDDVAVVHVVYDEKKGKYLRTTADSASTNNLDNLPDC